MKLHKRAHFSAALEFLLPAYPYVKYLVVYLAIAQLASHPLLAAPR